MLENYLQMFGELRTDRGRDRYPEIACHLAPHKPFLLLILRLRRRRLKRKGECGFRGWSM